MAAGGSRGFRLLAWLLALLFLIPFASPIMGQLSPIGAVQAANDCSTQGEPQWKTKVANASLDSSWNYYNDWGDESHSRYVVDDGRNRVLPLTQGFHVSQLVDNDSASGIRVNLTTGFTYTFCITTVAENSSFDTPIDVYLMTTYDWGFYQFMYDEMRNDGENILDLADIPPEYRSGIVWQPYRDVHAYERVTDTTFSVSLDHNETTTSMFEDETQYQEFYLLIDTWNNGRGNDAGDPGSIIIADITVMVEPKVLVPAWTVSLVCTLLMFAVAAAPVTLHMKYNRMGKTAVQVELMPSLEGDSS